MNFDLRHYSNRVWIPEGSSHRPNVTYRDGVPSRRYHSHEFCEITWLSAGTVDHWVGDEATTLSIGDVVLVRPDQVHGYQPTVDGTQIYNVMFIEGALQHLAKEYFGGSLEFWADQDAPRLVRLSEEDIDDLCVLFNTMQSEPRKRLYLDRFLLNALAIMNIAPANSEDSAPRWLADGMQVLQSPVILSDGLAAFYKACGRSPNHVARVCRKHLGLTPGRLVQNARLEHAARQLLETDNEVAEIAFDSGYNDLAHFYRHFYRRFNTSPGKFRKGIQGLPEQSNHGTVVGVSASSRLGITGPHHADGYRLLQLDR